MALELETVYIQAQTRKQLSVTRLLSATGKLKLELGEEELDTACPAGKTWSVAVVINIVEEDT